MKKTIVGCSVALLLVAGCTPASPPKANSVQGLQGTNAQQITYGMLGPGPINYGEITDEPDFYHEGYENHSTSFRTLTPRRQDLGDDEEKIRYVIEQEGLRAGAVIIAGSHAWVNVYGDGLSAEEQKEKEKQARQSLQRIVPRYQVHVNSPSSS
ncbi:hypothetical protein [Alkalihalobacterium bogoriense]|uniref:hypothetical protein n=1 Tax=Alkalihalobacterium bogoriense TaxID=246272 RepID=UPI00047E22FD|nr:hypothetical protein [Alkalihalobacterium bogoriense]